MKSYMYFFDSCVYSFDSKNNIPDEKDIGICADVASILTPERSVASTVMYRGKTRLHELWNFNIPTPEKDSRENSSVSEEGIDTSFN